MWKIFGNISTQADVNAVLTSGWLLAFSTAGLVFSGVAWGPYWSGAVLWGMALASAAFVVGFLFGVPKYEKPADDPKKPSAGGLAPNTNLERVSDWLTNIIVGLTLVNLGKVEYYVGRLAEFMVKQSGGGSVPVTWAIAMIVFFCSVGFLGGYLLTRMFLSRAFVEADQALGFHEQDLVRQAMPPSPDDKPAISADAREAMASIQNLDAKSARQSGVALDVLATAQLNANKPDAALATAEEGLRTEPNDPRLLYARAISLYRLGRGTEALQPLKDARAALTPSSDAELRASIYNSLTYGLLNADSEATAKIAVLAAQEYLNVDSTGAKGAIFVNLACACGQLAKFAGDNQDEIRNHGQAALDAIRSALAQDQAWLSKLRSLYHPAAGSKDDDLAVFAQSELKPQFDAALGLTSQ